jgi:hypothetical protein
MAVALRFTHVVAVGARHQLPVDAAPFIARCVGTVLGKLDARSTLAACVHAMPETSEHVPDDQVKVGGLREQRGRLQHRHSSLNRP